jgi:hypothetical protein
MATILGVRSFDAGATMLNDADVKNSAAYTASTTLVKTGTYSLRCAGPVFGTSTPVARWLLAGTPDTPSVSLWLHASSRYADGTIALRLRFLLGTGEYVELRWNATTKTFDAYVSNALVAAGTWEVSSIAWFHVQFYATIADAGAITCLIDGHPSIAYSGDTQPGIATGATQFEVYTTGDTNDYSYVDNLVFGYGGALGVLYCEDMRPNGDDTVQWTPSTGVLNYATIDETPVVDTDYNSTTTDGHKDLLDLSAWDGTDKDPVAAAAWVRAQMLDASGDSIIVGIDSNGTEDDTTSAIAASYEYYHHVAEEDPDISGPWTEVALNALLLKYESVIT